MELDYTTEGENIYYLCRKKAAEFSPKFKSRDGAAEVLGISAASLRDYETGVTKIVPPDIVLQMSIAYKSPELRNHYCTETCPIGKIQPIHKVDVKKLELDRLTLSLLSSFKDISNIKETLIDIAADGVIDDAEKSQLDYVLQTLDKISEHVQHLKIWAEREFGHSENR